MKNVLERGFQRQLRCAIGDAYHWTERPSYIVTETIEERALGVIIPEVPHIFARKMETHGWLVLNSKPIKAHLRHGKSPTYYYSVRRVEESDTL